MPHDFSYWKIVYTQFRTWKLDGFFKKSSWHLRKALRKLINRDEKPSSGIADSQSVKTAERGGVRGYEGAKKIEGRKRHILVDTQEFLLAAKVTAANLSDRGGFQTFLSKRALIFCSFT